MKFFIYLIIIYAVYIISRIIRTIISNYNKENEKSVGYGKYFILTKTNIVIENDILIDISKINFIHIGTLSVITNGENPYIKKLSLNILFEEKIINIFKRENSLKILKNLKKYDYSLFENLISQTLLVIPPIKNVLEKELEKLND